MHADPTLAPVRKRRVWSARLPYETAAEGAEWLTQTRQALVLAVHARDYGLGLAHAAKALKEYLARKYPLSFDDRAWFATALYGLACIPDLDLDLADVYASVATKLLKCEQGPPAHGLDRLGLAPHQRLPAQGLLPKQRSEMFPAGYKFVNTIIKLAEAARRHFAPDCAADILAEYLPRLNVHDLSTLITNLSLVSLFLPVHAPPSLPSPSDWDTLPDEPQQRFHWVPTLFSVWLMVADVPSYDMLFFDLFARLAESQVAHPDSVAWTDLQIRTVFTIGMKNLELPVGSGASGLATMPIRSNNASMDLSLSTGDRKIELMEGLRKNSMETFARFIVFTIFPAQSDPGQFSSNSLDHLETLIRAVESFYHPSNSGKWSYPLARFIQCLSFEFYRRLQLERKPDTQVPQHYRLSSDIQTRFVTLLRTVAYLAMFGKDPRAVSSANGALKYLAWVDPAAIVPGLLSRIYPSLETLTETHRTMSCIGLLYTAAIPIVSRKNYREGGQHLASLLELTLPGVDMNDISKSSSTLLFITNAVMTVPLIDGSASAPSMDVDSPDADADNACRLSTADFDAWVAKYIDRIMAIFENLPQNFGSGSSRPTSEQNLLDMIMFTSEVVFGQLSSRLEDMVIRKLAETCRSSVLPGATVAMGRLCGLIASANPRKRLAVFVPMCVSRIREELEHGAASKPSSKLSANANPFGFASMSDATLHWFQSILLSVVDHAGEDILEYKDVLDALLDEWTGKLLRNIVLSLTQTYPIESRSHPPSQWNSPEFQATSYMHWGEPANMDDPEIQWHTPTARGIEFAEQLLTKYSALAQSKLQALANDASAPGTEFGRWLSLHKNCLYGLGTLLRTERSMSHNNESEDLRLHAYRFHRLPLSSTVPFADPSSPKYKYWQSRELELLNFTHSLVQLLATERADDVEAAQAAISCVNVALSFRGVHQPTFETKWQLYKYAKSTHKLCTEHKELPRYLEVRAAHLVHLGRVKQASLQRPYTPLVQTLVDDLAELAVCKYAEIRKTAQAALGSALRCFPLAKYPFFPRLLANLDASSGRTDPDRMKGSLYVLRTSHFLSMYLYHWKYQSAFIRALVRAQHEDKPSILELIRKTHNDFLSRATGISITMPPMPQWILNHCAIVGDDLAAALPAHVARLADKTAESQQEYVRLVDSLTDFSQSHAAHWRFTAMAAEALDYVLRPEMPVTEGLARFALSTVVNEHPAMRRTGLPLMTHVLVILKERATAHGTSALASLKQRVPRAQVPDTALTVDLDADPYASGAPTHLTVYTGTHDGPTAFRDATSAAAHDVIETGVADAAFWDRWTRYTSQETSQTTERFSTKTANLVRRLAGLVPDTVAAQLAPVARQLAAQADDKSKQRAAAELVAGHVRGAKHWDGARVGRMWGWVLPLLEQAFAAATTESIGYWIDCVQWITASRDPNRYLPLARLKLFLAKAVLAKGGPRLADAAVPLLEQYVDAVRSPYDQVRYALGVLINLVVQIQWRPRVADIPTLVQSHRVYWRTASNASGDSAAAADIPIAAPRDPAVSASNYGSAAKTVLAWFTDGLVSYRVAGLYPYLPLLSRAADVARLYPNLRHHPGVVRDVLGQLLRLLRMTEPASETGTPGTPGSSGSSGSSSGKRWHTKIRVLPVIQVLFFRHLHLLPREDIEQTVDTVAGLLADPQVEVRHLASVTLAGLVRCSHRDAIDGLVARFTDMLAATVMSPRRRGGRSTPVAGGPDTGLVAARHAGVLGLAALVQAFPYEVPPWMPAVLVRLSACISDPAPVTTTVAKTFAEFKRTHQDNWAEDSAAFTPDQLYVLSDLLISPSYYA
ncbi:hypothetical protein BC831DRAFT_447887 [Entophlyctis helioformis]|nr:hypothetical protein BC831DRAFT_447887 [Entophlyctis helioformis]